MTRFGVMKHLKVLEAAGLVVIRWQGREKLHYLNPVPIRLIQIAGSTSTPSAASRRSPASKPNWRSTRMTTTTMKREDTGVPGLDQGDAAGHMGRNHASPDWNGRYGYGAKGEDDLRPGGRYRVFPSKAMKDYGSPDVIIDGEVVESDPPRKLVQTWRPLWDPETVAEGAKQLTWEIAEGKDGVCTLTVTHELTNAPKTRKMVSGEMKEAGGGWPMVLEDLKQLLETGIAPLGLDPPDRPPRHPRGGGGPHRRQRAGRVGERAEEAGPTPCGGRGPQTPRDPRRGGVGPRGNAPRRTPNPPGKKGSSGTVEERAQRSGPGDRRSQADERAERDEPHAVADDEQEHLPGRAPSASRMPISRVRRAIENASTP